MSVIYDGTLGEDLFDPCERIFEEEAIDELMAEFDRILTPVEKYIFCRKNGIRIDCEEDCRKIQKEVYERFRIPCERPSIISKKYRTAVRKLRRTYTKEDIQGYFL